MTPHELEALARLLYGREWMAPLARLLGVSPRNVQFWMAKPPAATKPIPGGIRAEVTAEIVRRVLDGEMDQDAPSNEAYRLADMAEAVSLARDAVGDALTRRWQEARNARNGV